MLQQLLLETVNKCTENTQQSLNTLHIIDNHFISQSETSSYYHDATNLLIKFATSLHNARSGIHLGSPAGVESGKRGDRSFVLKNGDKCKLTTNYLQITNHNCIHQC